MQRCIQVAKNGLGNTAPNPMVGCVIVHKNKIIGEGYTSPYGGSHAEVNAIHSVADTSLLKESTIYVSLEPCSHYGKTPPCADLIIKHQIKKVVIGTLDPHEKVAGKGIKKLQESGIDVVTHFLEKQCKEHHKRFLTYHSKKRPYIILKWAETKDGFIAPTPSLRKEEPKPYWITNAYSRQLVHKWRTQEQAILVGTTTALQDNPQLDARNWKGKNPVRIVIDKNLKLPNSLHLLDNSIKTVVFTKKEDATKTASNTIQIAVPFDSNLAHHICNSLYKMHITSVIIEGGSKTIETFINTNLWDEARVFVGDTFFKKGTKAPVLKKTITETKQISNDQLNLFLND